MFGSVFWLLISDYVSQQMAFPTRYLLGWEAYLSLHGMISIRNDFREKLRPVGDPARGLQNGILYVQMKECDFDSIAEYLS